MLKFNVVKPYNNENRKVQHMLEHTIWLSTQYQTLSSQEKREVERALEKMSEQPKTATQQANLGGSVGDVEQEPQSVKQLKRTLPQPTLREPIGAHSIRHASGMKVLLPRGKLSMPINKPT